LLCAMTSFSSMNAAGYCIPSDVAATLDGALQIDLV
jgi:hypothetical protein